METTAFEDTTTDVTEATAVDDVTEFIVTPSLGGSTAAAVGGAVGGVITALLAIIVCVLVIVIGKRRQKSDKVISKGKKQTEEVREEEIIGNAIDNILYEGGMYQLHNYVIIIEGRLAMDTQNLPQFP